MSRQPALRPSRTTLPVWLALSAGALAGVLLPFLLTALFPTHTELKSIILDKQRIAAEQGYSYSVAYPSDLDKENFLSFLAGPVFIDTQAVLFENGRPLSPHGGDHIATIGKGGYFFCPGKLYFSSSDNSDPRTNNKTYTVSGPAKPGLKSSKPFHLCMWATGFMLVLAALRARRYSKKLYCLAGGWVLCIVLGFPIVQGSSLFTYMPDELVKKNSILGTTLWDSVLVATDSPSYIAGSSLRTPGYPFFISHILGKHSVPPHDEAVAEKFQNADGHPLIAISRAQIMLFLCAIFVLGVALTRHVHIGAAYAAGIAFTLFGWTAISYLPRVLTEGILLSVVVALTAASFWSGSRPSGRSSVILAGLFVAALLVNPRSIAFAPFLLVPAASLCITSRKAGCLLRPAAWLPLCIVTAFYLSACGYTKYQYGAFSLAPFNGYSAISIALEFADPEDYVLFQDPKLRTFVQQALEGVAAAPSRWPDSKFINQNVWQVAYPLCRKTFAGDKNYYRGRSTSVHSACNAVFAEVSGVLLARHADRFFDHIRVTLAQMQKIMPFARGGHAFWLMLMGILLLRSALWRDTTSLVCAFLIIAHYSSMVLTGALQGPLQRYLLTTQWLLPTAACLFILDSARRITSLISIQYGQAKKAE